MSRFKKEEDDIVILVPEALEVSPITGTPERPEIVEQHKIMVEKAKLDQGNNEKPSTNKK